MAGVEEATVTGSCELACAAITNGEAPKIVGGIASSVTVCDAASTAKNCVAGGAGP